MKWFIALSLITVSLCLKAQPATFLDSLQVDTQTNLELQLPFANSIRINAWEKNIMKMEAVVEIDNGENNHLFSFVLDKNSQSLFLKMDDEMWMNNKRRNAQTWDCDHKSLIDFALFIPRSIAISGYTISGDFEFDYYGNEIDLETISGDIDISFSKNENFTFKAKMLNGSIYSDLDFSFPNGKEGLKQIVGSNIIGQLNEGSVRSSFETISGNIFLREKL